METLTSIKTTRPDDIIAGSREGPWTIRLASDHFILSRSDGGDHHEFRRGQNLQRIEWEGLTAARPYLIARIPKAVKLKVNPVDAATLSEWFGPPPGGHLRAALRRRMAWALPIGLLWLLSSLPRAGDAASALPAKAFDGVAAFLGTVLILESVLARTIVRRELFLLDAAWFVVLALDTLYQSLTSSHSTTWSALIVIYAYCILDDVKLYGDFAPDQGGET